MMDVGRKRGNGVVSGSVWENRIKLYDGKGGIKALINTSHTEEQPQNSPETMSDDKNDEIPLQEEKKLAMPTKPRSPTVVAASGKRKSWKSESLEGNPLQSPRKRSELCKNIDEQQQACKDLGKKTRSVVQKQKGPELRKAKSESSKLLNDDNGNGKLRNSNSLQLVKAKSASPKDLDDRSSRKELKFEENKDVLEQETKNCEGVEEVEVKQFEENKVVLEGENENKPNGMIRRTRSEDEIEVCEEKVITSNVELALIKSPPKVEETENLNDQEDEEEEEEEEEEDESETKTENKSIVVVKKMSISEQYKPNKIVTEEKKKIVHSYDRSVPLSPIVKKQPPPINGHARFHPTPSKPKQVPVSEDSHSFSRPQSRLQSLVDLVMWRDASKSALVFGIGTFLIISSSYTQDIKVSLVSVVSYMSLLYLAVIFLFRSLIHRGGTGVGERSEYVVGEEEAIWVLRLILPYINEFLLKIRALFSGDPATTMKMAVLLFVLAQCGSSITIWKMAKLGKFWVRRFRDAWESCTHKKAVAFGIFTLVWNLSTFMARIWAAFMLYVAFRYYQESKVREEWDGESRNVKAEEEEEGKIGQRQVGRMSTFMDTRKQKKPF
ncbi:PREDICTED: reticulon-like protein B21 isoform X2 [Ipomoea nil]|uniref:reticulon-like protein B21 isoform X2 n=1 Tax=Ipomoea nil TaxID=35883 RepID=UPI000901197D|nr:PREDICTED: reticulon-like protein B21 isoform X2 [Ipomoea nil]